MRNSRDKERVIDNLIKSTKRYSIYFKYPKIIELPNNTRISDFDQYNEIIKKADLLFFFITKYTAAWFYGRAKAHFNERGIPTQFYTSFNHRRDSLSKYGNMV